jgi:hypothetical protein
LTKKPTLKTTSNFRPRPKNQEIFFIEYGHDGYQKNPLLIQIPEKSTYLCDIMHPKTIYFKTKMAQPFSGVRGFIITFLPVTFLGAFCH